MRRDPGRVYVAENGRGWTKIGKTRQPVARRIMQLNDPNSEYSRYGPWRYVSHVYSDRHTDLEARAHTRLRWWRVSGRRVGSCREIFDVAPGKALDIIKGLNRGNGGLGGARMLVFLLAVVAVLFLATLMGHLP